MKSEQIESSRVREIVMSISRMFANPDLTVTSSYGHLASVLFFEVVALISDFR